MNYDTNPLLVPRRSYRLPLTSSRSAFRADALLGLSRPRKSIPSKYLFDATGSMLFEEIGHQPEYYPTRIEKQILRVRADEIAALVGPNATLIEPGCGNGEKIRCFLEFLETPSLYAPIDLARTTLDSTVFRFKNDYPEIPLLPLCADYSDPLALTIPEVPGGKRIVFFPGSTIGNLDPADVLPFLHGLSQIGTGLLIGVDTKKDSYTLNQAYNDRRGVTARFNLNLLARMNRELDANFDLERFEHLAFYNAPYGRVEMHLVSRVSQKVEVSGITFDFAPGETIQTEYSHKYTPLEFDALLTRAGYSPMKCWRDENDLYTVYYAEVASAPTRHAFRNMTR